MTAARFSVMPADDGDPVVKTLEGLTAEVRALAESRKVAPPSDHVVVPRWIMVSVLGVIMSAMVTVISVVFVTNKALNSLETLHGAEQRANDLRFLRNENEIRDINQQLRALQQRGGG